MKVAKYRWVEPLTVRLILRLFLMSLVCFSVPWVIGLLYPKAMPLLMFWGGGAYWEWCRSMREKRVLASINAIVAKLPALAHAAAPGKNGSRPSGAGR